MHGHGIPTCALDLQPAEVECWLYLEPTKRRINACASVRFFN